MYVWVCVCVCSFGDMCVGGRVQNHVCVCVSVQCVWGLVKDRICGSVCAFMACAKTYVVVFVHVLVWLCVCVCVYLSTLPGNEDG